MFIIDLIAFAIFNGNREIFTKTYLQIAWSGNILLTTLPHNPLMANIIEFSEFSDRLASENNREIHDHSAKLQGAIRNWFLARFNDRFRRKLSVRNDTRSSIEVMKVSGETLNDLLTQLTTAKYDEISFGSLPTDFVSDKRRRLAEALRSEGIIHAGIPTQHFVWSIDQDRKKIHLSIAQETLKV